MNQSYQLYQIDKEFHALIEDENFIDTETGEMSEELVKKIESLEIQKTDLIHYVGLTYHSEIAEEAKVDSEIKRLQAIKEAHTNRVAAMERLLEKYVRLGEKLKFDNLIIKWKTNPGSVETDIDLDIKTLPPEFIRVKYELDKTAIKNSFKATGTLPDKVRIVKSNSLVIK